MLAAHRHAIARRLAAPAAVLLLAACGSSSGPGELPTTDTSHVAVADPGSTLAPTWARGPFMEIYVRGYEDSDGDGIGDLRGLTRQLDYLHGLGITGIWLMPVTRSYDRDHGYAVEDYRLLERDYGSPEDLDQLLAQAHARGIGVILDYVMNHSAATNPLFLSSRRGAGDPCRGWYVWSSSHPGGWDVFGQDPWRAFGGAYYYAPFWDQMPDFDLTNPEVVTYHHDNLRFWLNRGVDGFRFDAVGNFVEHGPSAWADQPEDFTLTAALRTELDAYAGRFMVCEGPGAPQAYTASCGSAFAFDHNHDLVAAARGDASAVAAVGAYFTNAPPGMATMISNHDRFAGQRLWDQVGGNLAQYKLAAATYLLQPGIPFIYYGEEIGLAGNQALSGDWPLRTPMSWSGGGAAGFTSGTPFRALSPNHATQNVAAEAGVDGSLLEHYRTLIALRHAHPALEGGSYRLAYQAGTSLAFERVLDTQRALVLINYGTATAPFPLTGLPHGTTYTPDYPGTALPFTTDGGGAASVSVPAQSFAVYEW